MKESVPVLEPPKESFREEVEVQRVQAPVDLHEQAIQTSWDSRFDRKSPRSPVEQPI